MSAPHTRRTLERAACVAGQLGFEVKYSTYNRRVSSYYIRPVTVELRKKYGDHQMRISDHALPINHKRDMGYQGFEIIIDRDLDCRTIASLIDGIYTGKIDCGLNDLSDMLGDLDNAAVI